MSDQASSYGVEPKGPPLFADKALDALPGADEQLSAIGAAVEAAACVKWQ